MFTCTITQIQITPTVSPANVSVNWSGPGGFISTQQNPMVNSPGLYSVTITDPGSGCTASDVVVVLQNSIPPSAMATGGTLSCNQSSVTLQGSTNAPGAMFFWTGPNLFGSSLQNPVANGSGTYTLVVTDPANGCTSSDQATVDSISNTPQINSTPPTCAGLANGSISITPTSGTPPYTFAWSGSNGFLSTLQNPVNLPSGTYTLIISDATGCTSINSISLNAPAPISIAPFICESSLTAVVTGGAAPYQYFWSNGATGPTASPLQPGAYVVTVQDAHGCIVSDNLVLSLGNNPSCTRITGRVNLDQNNDCLPDSLVIGLGGWYLKAAGPNGIFYGITDSAGTYDLRLLPGDYTVSAIPLSVSYTVCVPEVAVSLLQTGDSTGVNFAAQGANPNCPAMTVDLSTSVLRRCFSNNFYTLHYCNNSPAAAPDAYILLTLDPLISIVTSARPYTVLANNVYRFNLGVVSAFECSQFNVFVHLSCDATPGQTHCSEAHIFPDTLCSPPNLLWQGAEVSVRSECATDSLHFILKNIGTGPMTGPLDYIVIEDGIMGLQGSTLPLAAGDSMLVSVPANGSTWRVEASQADYFPGQSIPVLSVEGCTTSGSFTTGYVQQFPANDADPFLDVDCTTNTGSYDPNDKQGLPLGYGAAHYIRPGTDIEYLIRFQNTGTDTAFTVIVRDTLAAWLDPETVRPGGSSHDYHFAMTGNGILVFDFQNILLPDSNVNEAASHGFLKFRVSQRTDVPLETDILNRAAIYFDFNEPVLTNTTVHRVGENFVVAGLWQPEQPAYHVQIAPHPLRDASWLEVLGGPEQGDYRLQIYDATGRSVQEIRSASPRFRVEKAGLSSGAYLFRVELEGVLVGQGILLAQ